MKLLGDEQILYVDNVSRKNPKNFKDIALFI